MKTVIYQNYDTECVYCGNYKIDPFAECFNPFVFAQVGKSNHWVITCEDCIYRNIEAQGFEYKVGVLISKIGAHSV